MRRSGFARRLLGVAALLLVFATGARAAHAATASVSPADTTVTINGAFTLRFTVDAVSDLKGWQLIYTYPPTRLRFDGATEGEVLTSGGLGLMFVRDDVAPHDSLWLDCARLQGSTAGPGVLAYLHFTALQAGLAPIECASVDFRDSANAMLFPGCGGGLVHVLGPVDVVRRTWGALKHAYR